MMITHIDLTDRLYRLGIIPVVTLDDPSQVVELGAILLDAGLHCAEVTFRRKAAETAIQNLIKTYPEILVGAGSVLTIEQAEMAIQAGAKFLVTPGFDEAIIDYCSSNGVQIIPGIATPSEINWVLKKNLSICKFFPAEAMGGIKTLKAISQPYQNVRFIPTGGINADNLKSYLELPQVLCCGGSWMVQEELLTPVQFDTISLLIKQAVKLVSEVRS